MSFEPLIPPSLWMALAVIGGALLVWYALRRPESIGRGQWTLAVALMTTALATVLAVLLNPTWVTELPPPPGKPLLSVLVDDSGSMIVADGESGSESGTRYQVAAKVAESLVSSLENQFDVQVRTFSEASSPRSVSELVAHEPKGQATDLAVAVADVLAEDRPQGQAVVVLSDGIHNVPGGAQSVRDVARRAKSLAAPVYTQTIGGTAGSALDLELELASAQELAFINQGVRVSALVSGRGAKGGRADVTLLYDGKEVGRESVTLPGPDQKVEARFWIKQEKMGLFPYEARIEPLPGEATQANNSATYVLRVIDEPIKVLLVEGKPYWDSKFLMRTLSSVPAVELESLVRVTDQRMVRRKISRKGKPDDKPAGDQKEVERAETWDIATDAANVFGDPARLREFQIVVLGRESEAFLTDQAIANLQEWVAKDGGALICSRGSPTVQVNPRLAKLLPVKWTPSREGRFRMRLTDAGRDMQWLGDDPQGDNRLAALPTLASSAQVSNRSPLAQVLATGMATAGGEGGTPAVIFQPYNTGRVIVIEGAGMWRWAFLPPQYQQQEEVYASLWHSLLRFVIGGAGLLPGQKMALRANRISFATEEPASATLEVRQEAGKGQAPAVELTGAALPQPRSFSPSVLGEEPGRFRVDFGKLPAGRDQARVTGNAEGDVASKCVFDVRVIGQEQLNLQARPDLMAHLAADAGGVTLGDDPAGQISRLFKEHITRTRPPRHERSTAWDRWWVLLGVFGLWTLSWAVRRSGGLI